MNFITKLGLLLIIAICARGQTLKIEQFGDELDPPAIRHMATVAPYRVGVAVTGLGACTISSVTDDDTGLALYTEPRIADDGTGDSTGKIIVEWDGTSGGVKSWAASNRPGAGTKYTSTTETITVNYAGGCSQGTFDVALQAYMPFAPPEETNLATVSGCSDSDAAVFGDETCTITNELPPSNSFSIPAVGSNWTDPNFGGVATRFVDTDKIHAYSAITPFTKDETYAHLFDLSGGHYLYDVSDGSQLCSGLLGTDTGTLPYPLDEDIYWRRDGETLIKHTFTGLPGGCSTTTDTLDYSGPPWNFTDMRTGGETDMSEDGWLGVGDNGTDTVCAIDLSQATSGNYASHTYCYTDWTGIPGPAIDDLISGRVLVTQVDRGNGKRYVCFWESPSMACFSVDMVNGDLDFEFRGPELLESSDPDNDGDGICEVDESCLAEPHADNFETTDGIQYFSVTLSSNDTPNGRHMVHLRVSAGDQMFIPAEAGGGMHYILEYNSSVWMDKHVGCHGALCLWSTNRLTSPATGYRIKAISKASPAVVSLPSEDATSVDTGTDEITFTGVDFNSLRIETGDLIEFSTTGTLPSPLVAGTDYCAQRIGGQSSKLQVDAYSGSCGSLIDLTTTGSGTHTVYELHGWSTSDVVAIGAVEDSTFAADVEGAQTVTVVNDYSFSLDGVDTTGDTTYTEYSGHVAIGNTVTNYPFAGRIFAVWDNYSYRPLLMHRTVRSSSGYVATEYWVHAMVSPSWDYTKAMFHTNFGKPKEPASMLMDTTFSATAVLHVAVSPTDDEVVFGFQLPSVESCTFSVSAQPDLSSPGTDTVTGASGQAIVGSLSASTQYWWRGVCGLYVRQGAFVTAPTPSGNETIRYNFLADATGNHQLEWDDNSAFSSPTTGALVACTAANVCEVEDEVTAGDVYWARVVDPASNRSAAVAVAVP